jgi:hypothetical protein
MTQKTIGMVRVAFFSAIPGLMVWATSTSGRRPTSSFAASRDYPSSSDNQFEYSGLPSSLDLKGLVGAPRRSHPMKFQFQG